MVPFNSPPRDPREDRKPKSWAYSSDGSLPAVFYELFNLKEGMEVEEDLTRRYGENYWKPRTTGKLCEIKTVWREANSVTD